MDMNNTSEHNKNKCLNCGTEFSGKFCPECGQSADTKRLSFRRAITETIPDIYNLDNKFVLTCIDLFRKPGDVLRGYIEGRRMRYYRPVPMLFVLATIYVLISHLTQTAVIAEVPIEQEDNKIAVILFAIINIINNKAWLAVMSVILFVVPNYIAFKHSEYGSRMNLAEHFFVMIYKECQGMIISLFMLIAGLFVDTSIIWINLSLIFGLLLVDYKCLLRISWIKAILLSFYSWILFALFVAITAFIIGFIDSYIGIFDFIIKILPN